MRPAIVSLLVLFTSTACAVEPAPEDVDGLLRWLFRNHAAADDVAVAEAFATADETLGALDDPRTGTISSLTEDDVAHVERETSPDPADAQGFFIATRFPCSIERMEEIVTEPDQNAQYEAYDSYERTYTSDIDAYFERSSPTLTWDIDLQATPITATYTALFTGGVRRVEESDAALLQHTWMPEPAVFEQEGNVFEQDYQIEAYFPRGDDVVHLYGMWRQMEIGQFTIEDDVFLTTLVEGLIDWDRRTEELCAAGS